MPALSPAVHYAISLRNDTLYVVATLNGRTVAEDSEPWINRRSPRPAECARLAATLHVKALLAIAATSQLSLDELKQQVPMGRITLPDGSPA
jgi:hypothetical protein